MSRKILAVFALLTFLCLSGLFLVLDNKDGHLYDAQRFEQISSSKLIIAEPRQLTVVSSFRRGVKTIIAKIFHRIESKLGKTRLSEKVKEKLIDELQKEADSQEEIRKLLGSVEPSCINGKDPKSLTPKEQLLEFVKGPCAPVILVPGIFATKLTVHIDCEVLSTSHPEIFSACGWSTCSDFKFWRSKPASDYKLWIGDFLSPMTILTDDGNKCLGNLIQFYYDPNQASIYNKYTMPAGVTVNVYGKKGTAYATDGCGLDAASDLLPLQLQTGSSRGFKVFTEQFEALGYQSGLTLYGAAYDWRSTTVINGVAEGIKTTVNQIYDLTGKKTVIVGHSLGNVGSLTALNTLSFAEKEKYIANFVLVASAILGAPKLIRTIMGGNPEYGAFGHGLDFNAQQFITKNSSSTFDIFPQDVYDRFAGTAWMADWKQRRAMEQVYIDNVEDGVALWTKAKETGNYPFAWFPTPLENCTVGFTGKPDYCGMFMYNWSNETIADIKGTTYSGGMEGLDDLLDKFTAVDINSRWRDILNDSMTDNVHLITNPEVPVTFVFVSHLATEKAYTYNEDPVEHAHDDKFVVPDIITQTPGDATVPTASSLIPALKWSWEYDHRNSAGGVKNAKPVKTIEMCSVLNNRGTIYDVVDPSKPYEINNNEYIGVPCSCQKGTYDKRVEGSDCEHSAIISDYNLATFLTTVTHTNQVIVDVQSVGAYNLTDVQIDDISKTCPIMNNGISLFPQSTQSIQI